MFCHSFFSVGPWVNNCVGLNNYRFFYCFLLWTCVGSCYVAYLLLPVVISGPNPIFQFTDGIESSHLISRFPINPDNTNNGGIIVPKTNDIVTTNGDKVNSRRKLFSNEIVEMIHTNRNDWHFNNLKLVTIDNVLDYIRGNDIVNSDSVDRSNVLNKDEYKSNQQRYLRSTESWKSSTYWRNLDNFLEDVRNNNFCIMIIFIFSTSFGIAVGILLFLHTYLSKLFHYLVFIKVFTTNKGR